MKKPLPQTCPVDRSLFALPREALKWELLKTALEMGLFDYLCEPASSDDIADELALHPQNTLHLLNGLAAIGCLHKADGRFRNTATTETYFVRGKETSVGDVLLMQNHWNKSLQAGGMKEIVKNGPPPPRSMNDEAMWERGARVSLNHARCGRAQRVAAFLSELPESPKFKRMLDMGAGPGVIGIAVTAAHPSLECVLFDKAAVCNVAEEVIAEYGMEDRVTTVHGDYMADPIGGDYDLVMANYTLNFYHDRLDEIVEKVYAALNPGGVFLVCSDGLYEDRTAPGACVLSWLCMWMQGMDMSFERGQIPDAMLRAGFVSTQSRLVDESPLDAHGPVDMIVGRKAG